MVSLEEGAYLHFAMLISEEEIALQQALQNDFNDLAKSENAHLISWLHSTTGSSRVRMSEACEGLLASSAAVPVYLPLQATLELQCLN